MKYIVNMIVIKKTKKSNITLEITQEDDTFNVFTFYKNNKPFSAVKYHIKKIDFENQTGFNDGVLAIGNGTIALLEKEIIINYGKNNRASFIIEANQDYRGEMFGIMQKVFSIDVTITNKKISTNPFIKKTTNISNFPGAKNTVSTVDYINAGANMTNAAANGLNAITGTISALKGQQTNKLDISSVVHRNKSKKFMKPKK